MNTLQTRLHRGDPPAGLGPLAARTEGSFFQTPGWLRAVVRAEPRLAPLTVVAEDASGTLRGACPLLAARTFGLWRLYGGAWGTYGGILAADEAAAAAVRAGLTELARRPRVALLRIHDFAGTLGPAALPDVASESCQVLDLPADPATLFEAFTSQNRNKIRKAEKLGVTVRCANDAAALAAYAALYQESAGRWGVLRPLPAAVFAALAGQEGVQVWLADLGGETIAALLNFTCGGQVMNWGNVSRRDSWSASPNNLLHWRALASACPAAGGPRLYNFGASTGLPGVETFKAAFGVRVHTYARREARAGWLGWLERARRRGEAVH